MGKAVAPPHISGAQAVETLADQLKVIEFNGDHGCLRGWGLAAGKTTAEIGRELGMRGEEIFRLSDFDRADFLKLMAKGATGYSPATLFLRT